MRRTLAVAGAAAIALVGLAGPAHADNGIFAFPPELEEIAVDLNDAGPNGSIDGTYIEIINAGTTNGNLQGLELRACTSSNNAVIHAFGSETLAAGQIYTVANQDYTNGGGPNADVTVTGPNIIDNLTHAAGGTYLFDPDTSDVLHGVYWGAPAGCLAPAQDPDMVPATESPTNLQSICSNTTPPWSRTTPGTCRVAAPTRKHASACL